MPYQITEPHPSVPSARSKIYFPVGIGGAGNMRSYTSSTLTSGPSATGPASLTSLTPPPTSAARMMTGRGGAGNVRHKPTPASTTAAAKRPASIPSVARQSFSSATSDDEAGHRAIFSFDEELQREQRMHDNAARVYIGRGGAGNLLRTNTSSSTATTASQPGNLQKGRAGSIASASSASSAGSARRGLGGVVDGIRRTLSRN